MMATLLARAAFPFHTARMGTWSSLMTPGHTRRVLALFFAAALALLALGSASTPAAAHGAKLTHSQAAARLRAADITWSSSGNCSNRHNVRCTSFEQINAGTINGIITFKRASGCTIQVTGGTETGHSGGTHSHWNGYKIDIALTPCVANYITRHFTQTGTRKDGATLYRSAAGNVYARESNHWDILYY